MTASLIGMGRLPSGGQSIPHNAIASNVQRAAGVCRLGLAINKRAKAGAQPVPRAPPLPLTARTAPTTWERYAKLIADSMRQANKAAEPARADHHCLLLLAHAAEVTSCTGVGA
jgi:hypothetical protein